MANTSQKRSVNQYDRKRGWLFHDNKLWDRKCPSCGAMFSSYETAVCKNCNQPLVLITLPDGRPISISEGTINLMLSTYTRDRIEKDLQRGKNVMPIKYRFKMYNISNDGSAPAPHILHQQMKKGTLVEIVCINHPPKAKWFQDGKKQICVELMYRIYDRYGDTIRVLAAPKEKAEAAIVYNVDASGKPANVPVPFPGAVATQSLASMTPEQLRAKQVEIQLEINKKLEAEKKAANPVAYAAANAVEEFEEMQDADFDVPNDTDPF